MPILRVGKKEYNVTLLDKKNNPVFLKLSSERKILDNILSNLSQQTIDPKSDIDTIGATLYKYLKNTKIKFNNIKLREI
ncbi:hypothetical protein [Fusobacterium varium]|uniref:hypothetical protein n=1 Tax=Fusobacterium varium TaxID=856 RepID=UPI0024316D73|nr:hypothetical protein [Fusobacterium varium]MCF0171616.1 hypothetical protein [Fusobacterium varium]